MSDERLTKGLAAFLSREWGAEVTVDNLRVASAGARRLNVLFDATRDGETLRLAATANPGEAMQLMDVEVEASNVRFAEAAGMPVAHVYAVCTDPSYIGGVFFVSSRVDGESIPRQVLRLVESQGMGDELARQCGRAFARLHLADPAGAHPDLDRPPPGVNGVEHRLAKIDEQMTLLLQPSPTFTLAYNWLQRNAPPSPRLCVIHHDFRNGNIIVGPDGLRAVVDWEACGMGDPMEDLAWMCQRMWRFRNDHLEVGGFSTREHLRAGYEGEGGAWNEDSFFWWKVMGFLRWGLGLNDQARQHLDKSLYSIVMAGSGRRIAEQEYDLLMLLRGRV